VNLEFFYDFPFSILPQGGGRGERYLERAQIIFIEIGMRHDQNKLRGNHEGVCAFFILNQFEKQLYIKSRHDDERAFGKQGGQHRHPCAVCVQGGGQEADGIGCNPETDRQHQGEIIPAVVGVDNPFGSTGCSGTVNDVEVVTRFILNIGCTVQLAADPFVVGIPPIGLKPQGEKSIFTNSVQSILEW